MNSKKSAFWSKSTARVAKTLVGTGIGSFLFAHGAIATSLTTTSPAITTPVASKNSPATNQHPVVSAVRDQLGITPLQAQDNHKQPRLENSDLRGLPLIRAMAKLASPAPAAAPDSSEKTTPKSPKQALAAFYGQNNRHPIWVSTDHIMKKTLAVIDELQHADRYGLRPRDFTLPEFVNNAASKPETSLSPEQLAKVELALSKTVLKYANYAKGGRIDPRKLSRFQDRGPRLPDSNKVLSDLANSDDPAAVLHALHPQHPQFKALRKKLLQLIDRPGPHKQAKAGKRPGLRFPASGPTLRFGMKHPQIILLRKRLHLNEAVRSGEAALFDKTVLDGVKKFQKNNKIKADGVVGQGTRNRLAGIGSPKNSSEKLRARLLINMERWRWMPDRLQGNNNIYVWANVPELRVRIIREGKVIFAEKVIAGQPAKQSPMFSDKMEWIEFNPTWFVPDSIKVADILPSLRRKGRVMSRYHLKLDCGKFGNDFSSIDWNKVDIRKCAVTQPAGAKSVLGKLKFKFPNKHSVYMHDTLTPGLFNRKHRVLSHGCIRVKNPRRMAEVLLASDKGMSARRVGSLLAGRGLHTEYLSRSIPVHITYFSTRVKKDGSLAHYPDYYGHDKRLAEALLGKGHLFKGAIYGGSSRYRRKRRPRPPRPAPTPSVNPRFFPEQ